MVQEKCDNISHTHKDGPRFQVNWTKNSRVGRVCSPQGILPFVGVVCESQGISFNLLRFLFGQSLSSNWPKGKSVISFRLKVNSRRRLMRPLNCHVFGESPHNKKASVLVLHKLFNCSFILLVFVLPL